MVIGSPAEAVHVRVRGTKVGWSAEGKNALGGFGPGGMLPLETLQFSFSKMHILHILREN